MKKLLGLIMAMLAGACAELTAEAPLFSTADQIGPPPLTEGIWISVGEDCPAHNARRRGRFPRECVPAEISRLPDGAWRFAYRADLMRDRRPEDGEEMSSAFRLIIAPATESASPESYAALYLAEYSQIPDTTDDDIGYAVIAPIGTMPATELFVVASIGCDEILRGVPIEGVTREYAPAREEPAFEGIAPTAPETSDTATEAKEGEPQLSGCKAATQAAVREAARRSLIENLNHVDDMRLVYVRPN